MAERIWTLLTATQRSSQLHGIDEYLLHRPNGNMAVYCPVCPEQDVNLEAGYELCPYHLR
jgi:hypothetical protein